jgi:hypothetical protein
MLYTSYTPGVNVDLMWRCPFVGLVEINAVYLYVKAGSDNSRVAAAWAVAILWISSGFNG